VNPIEFQRKWRANTQKERTASQSHFNDLCELVGHPKPLDLDPKGEFFTFEKGASKLRGNQGWADVWYRGRFAVEYKGRGKDLKAAYNQLAQYVEDLENPPLLIVSDLDRIEIHTHFTNTVKKVYAIDLSTITEPESLRVLKAAFFDPESLKPATPVDEVTKEASRQFSSLAAGLRSRGADPQEAAHFLMHLLFCLFAEDIGILPNTLFSKVISFGAKFPARFNEQIGGLLEAMASGGFYSLEQVPHVNGGLFRTVKVFDLTQPELQVLEASTRLDWSSIEPAIFGTLFERSLDPSRRAQLGAHYTGRNDILRVVEPVVMTPLRREWETVRAELDGLRAQAERADTTQKRRNAQQRLAAAQGAFLDRLAAVKVLDPACGSGNFLYVALARLLALEKEVIRYGAEAGLSIRLPQVGPRQLLGMEIDPLARELAQVAIWIGYLQWMIDNGFGWKEPVLEPLETIRLQDALLTTHENGTVTETGWPASDFIIGNPPFVGGNKLRQELGDETVNTLFRVYSDRVPRFADLCCYFFEQARAQIAAGKTQRAGLLATNSIRGGVNREVLKRIKESGDIYMAWPDEPWILDGAAVRISIVGFDNGSQVERTLNGQVVVAVNADLTSSLDISRAAPLPENEKIAFQGTSKKGPFDIPGAQARQFLAMPTNPNGRPNSDVVRPWMNGKGLSGRWQDEWIIDFGTELSMEDASLYEGPFEYAKKTVLPIRENNNRSSYRERWWRLAEARPGLRAALIGKERYIATTIHAKYRIFAWIAEEVVPDQALIAFARDDDYFFGVLHSRAHEVWSLRMGTWLGKGNDPRYTPTTCFETFPLPWPPGDEPVDDLRVIAIGEAAAKLDQLRRNWLDPEGASEAELKKRTLTNLYNQRPTWLQHAHAALDRAVWAAYGWDDPDPAAVEEDTILARLLALNGERASAG
jgi:hypothetical protein